MVPRVILIIAVAWALFAQAAEAQEVGPIKVLRYDSEVAVEELLVYGRFVNGAELKCVYELLGVEPEKTAAEKCPKCQHEDCECYPKPPARPRAQ